MLQLTYSYMILLSNETRVVTVLKILQVIGFGWIRKKPRFQIRFWFLDENIINYVYRCTVQYPSIRRPKMASHRHNKHCYELTNNLIYKLSLAYINETANS